MTKIMLVEDDKSLREIYGVRLLAEGYDIVSASDGEEALAMAIKERPQLIVSDVMMPKISGFDMLDILRSTTETKNIKVIMMTALSSEEQRTRGESLGADRYLVKSQVGIEDVVRVVHEVLADQGGAPAPATAASPAPAAAPQPQAAPAPPRPAPTAPPRPQSIPVTSPAPMPTPAAPAPAAPAPQPPVNPSTAPKPPSLRSRVIEPLNDPNKPDVDLNSLLDKELAKEVDSTPATAAQEKAIINDQLANFTPPVAAAPGEGDDDVPAIQISTDGTATPEAQDQQPAPAAPAQQPVNPGTPPPPPPVTPPTA